MRAGAAARTRAGQDPGRRGTTGSLGRRSAPRRGRARPAGGRWARGRRAKVFCSGAGGLDAALVLVRGEAPGPPRLVYVDLTSDVEVDREWYRAAGMRASESHRVVFHGARVLAVLGEPGELGREPWFGRDAIRTAACWAGLVDAVREEALALLTERATEDDLAALAAGRMIAHAATVDALAQRSRAPDGGGSGHTRLRPLGCAARRSGPRGTRTPSRPRSAALGSRPLAASSRLDRARRDLEVFLHQHRLDPLLARIGRQAAAGGRDALSPEEAPARVGALLLRGAVRARPRSVALRVERVRARQVRPRARHSGPAPFQERPGGGLLDRRVHRTAGLGLWRSPRRRPLRARRGGHPGSGAPPALGTGAAAHAARGDTRRAVPPDRLLGGPLLLARGRCWRLRSSASPAPSRPAGCCWRCTTPSARAPIRFRGAGSTICCLPIRASRRCTGEDRARYRLDLLERT